MSNAVFPTLPGLTFDILKNPRFNTLIQKAVSGKEYRTALMQYPLWDYTLAFELLRSDNVNLELQTLVSFYNARQGSFDNFLFSDPDDNATTLQNCANTVTGLYVGDGATTTFQMGRAYNTFWEPTQNINAITNVYVNGVSTSAYTVANGLLTFSSAPGSGQSVTWTGTFYYRARFSADTIEFNKFYQNMWETKKVEFVASPRNMV